MKIAIINRTDKGSSGVLAFSIFNACKNNGDESIFLTYDCSSNDNVYSFKGNRLSSFYNKLLTKIDGSDGFRNTARTKKIIKFLEKFRPDIISIHNIVGYFINLPLLVNYCHSNGIKVVFTLHDCWIFTGKCTHFEFSNCYKWKKSCGSCPLKKEYPQAYLCDKTSKYLQLKKEILSLENVFCVCPSEWLYNYLLSLQYIDKSRVFKINNGIEINTNPICKVNSTKKTLLFVAYPWTEKKGIKTIEYLYENLDISKFEFLIIGSKPFKDTNIDSKCFIEYVSHDCIHEFYSKASIFVNPTLEDNFPTVDIEALSFGLPIISYDTGGSKEIIGNCGRIVRKNDMAALLAEIQNFDLNGYDNKISFNRAQLFSRNIMNEKYLNLFKEIYAK